MRNYKQIVCALLFCLSGAGAMGQQGVDTLNQKALQYSYEYLQGVRFKNMGALKHAATMFERVIKNQPGHAAAYYQMAEIASTVGDQDASLKYARAAYRRDTSYREYASDFARKLLMSSRFDEAEKIYESLFRKDSTDAEVLSMLALIRFETGEYQQVLNLVDTVEKRAGIRGMLVDMKRQSLIRLENYREAYDYMEHVVDVIPEQPGFHVHLAELAAALRKDSVALAHYQAAIDLEPNGLGPRFSLMEYYRIKEMKPQFYEILTELLGQPEWPVEDKISYVERYAYQWNTSQEELFQNRLTYVVIANTIRQCDVNNVKVKSFYIRHLMSISQFDEAHRLMVELMDSDQADEGIYMGAIEMAAFREQPDTVKKYVREAEVKFPKNENLQLFMFYIQLQQGDTIGAMEMGRRMIKRMENDTLKVALYGAYADIQFMRGEKKRAFKLYEKALKIIPDNATVLNNYAYFLSLEKKDLNKALRMSTQANELEPQNPVFLDTQAWIYYQMGEHEDAQTIMRQALVLDKTNSAELLLHFGDISEALGQRFTAETYWKRALEAGADPQEIEKRLGK